MTVAKGRVVNAKLVQGNPETIEEHKRKLSSDPVTGELGELGFGTQLLPTSGRDIQDEKILGTLHVATGRSDHLGGHLTPDKFANQKNARMTIFCLLLTRRRKSMSRRFACAGMERPRF